MSQITRCPSCGTMFKVVPDQLRVSEGWVRCGHCAEVFDATQNMWAPPEQAAQSSAPAPLASRTSVPPPGQPNHPAGSSATDPIVASPSAAGGMATHGVPAASAGAAPTGSRMTTAGATPHAGAVPAAQRGQSDLRTHDTPAFEDTRDETRQQMPDERHEPVFARRAESAPEPGGHSRPGAWQRQEPPLNDPDTVLMDQDPPMAELFRATDPPAEPAPAAPAAAAAAAAPRAEPEPQLSFLAPEQKPSVWRKPAVRIGLIVLVLVLLAALLFQLLVHERNRIAATAPASRVVLATICEWTGCTLGPLRQIESVVIDNSSFSRIRGDDYRLGFSLRNMAAIDIAIPAIELALTNTQDQALVRRVIHPSEFGAPNDVLAASSIWSASLALRVEPSANPAAGRIAGYRLLAFYP